jgi:signal transduction histidine kinase/ligand-binding sensor domain-containing protein
LLRFDGIRFVSLNDIVPGPKPPLSVTALYGAGSGSLWIGTSIGLLKWDGARIISLPLPGRIEAITESADGLIWITRARIHDGKGGVCSIAHDVPRCFNRNDGNPFDVAIALASTPSGEVWTGIGSQIAKVGPTVWEVKPLPSHFNAGVSDGVYAMASSHDGSVWVGSITGGPGGGLQHLVNGAWEQVLTSGVQRTALEITSLIQDSQGSMWIGTLHEGLLRLQHGKIDSFGVADGFSAEQVNSVFQDLQGNIWVGTSRGLDRFRDLPVTSVTTREGLASDESSAVLGTRDGQVLVSGRGLSMIGPDGIDDWSHSLRRLPHARIAGLFQDQSGAYWFGCGDALYVLRGQTIKRVVWPDGSNTGVVRNIAQETNGDLWIATTNLPTGIVRVREDVVTDKIVIDKTSRYTPVISDLDGKIYVGLPGGGIAEVHQGQLIKSYLPRNKEANGSAQTLVTGSNGDLWALTLSGIELVRSGELRKLTTATGLPCQRMFAAAESSEGDLWISSECGIFRLSRTSIERWWRDGSEVSPSPLYKSSDGAQTEMSPFSPSASRSHDGRLWFANDSVLQYVDPNQDPQSSPLPVRVESVMADGRSYSILSSTHLPPRPHAIEIQYTAIDLASPQKVNFRYMLEGSDASWQYVGPRRTAFFENLPPGRYNFRVQASNRPDVWFEAGNALTVTVSPAFYQQLWFRFVLILLFILILWLLNQLRLRRALEQLTVTLNARHKERINIARDLHDTLLQGIQGLTLQLHSVLLKDQELPAIREEIQVALSRTDALMADGRERVQGLRSANMDESSPLDISSIASQLSRDPSIRLDTVIEGLPIAVEPMVKAEVIDILREALNNAFRHSNATHVELRVSYSKRELRVSVRDNGKGIHALTLKLGRKNHWGIQGMRERAARIGGDFHIASACFDGTSVELSVPAKLAYTGKRLKWKLRLPLRNRREHL